MPIALEHKFCLVLLSLSCCLFVPSYCMILLWNSHFYLGGQLVSNKASLAALRLYNYFFMIDIVVLIGK